MYDAIHISDLHIGSTVCQLEKIEKFLWELPPVRRLVLGGDVLQSVDNRLTKRHWKVLSSLRKLSDTLELVWVSGNHDADAEHIAHLIGAHWCRSYAYRSGDEKILTVHGDIFDDFLKEHPVITHLADWFHLWIQKLSPDWAFELKRSSKTYLRCAEIVREKACRYAKKHDADIIICGHTHHAEHDNGFYYNTGCWTQPVCSFVTVDNGKVYLDKL